MIVPVSCAACGGTSEASTTLYGGFVPCRACGEDLAPALQVWIRTSPSKPAQGPFPLDQVATLIAEGKVHDRMLLSGDGERFEPGSTFGGLFRPVTAGAAASRDAAEAPAADAARERIDFCESCQAEMPWGAARCPACGTTRPGASSGPAAPPPTHRRCPACAEPILAAARKCKHCGEWVDGPAGEGAGDAYGTLLLLVPLALAVMMLAALFIPGAGGFAMPIAWLLAIASALLVGADAHRLGVGRRHPGPPPAVWGLFVFLLWFIGYPAYMGMRGRYGARNLIVGGLLITLFVCLMQFAVVAFYGSLFARIR